MRSSESLLQVRDRAETAAGLQNRPVRSVDQPCAAAEGLVSSAKDRNSALQHPRQLLAKMISGLDWRRGINDQVNREGHAPWYLMLSPTWILGCLGNASDLRVDYTTFWNSRQSDLK